MKSKKFHPIASSFDNAFFLGFTCHLLFQNPYGKKNRHLPFANGSMSSQPPLDGLRYFLKNLESFLETILVDVHLTQHLPKCLQHPPQQGLFYYQRKHDTIKGKAYKFTILVGGFNPFEKYLSNWIMSPSRGENKEYLKPPPRIDLHDSSPQ